jgi:2-polyprenyl-3-methyl-5-hydroxy-6-metoxy-1,4-benzoquinol methylase
VPVALNFAALQCSLQPNANVTCLKDGDIMKKHVCKACGSNSIKQLNYTLSYGNYLLMVCDECGLKFILSDKYDTLDDDLYWDSVNKKIYSTPEVLKEFKKKHKKYLQQIIKNRPRNRKLLDVGSGSGIFLNNAKECNFDVCGVEPSEIAVELCKEQYNIEAFCGYLDLNSELPRDYGVLSAWDVIEHVADPKEFLQICHAHLTEAGILLLETPDESCVIRKVINIIDNTRRAFGFNPSTHIYYPSHRYYFTHKSITHLLNDVGFTKIKFFKEHSIYSKAKEKYRLYRTLSKTQMVKYDILFFILKFPLFWNKQVILCTKR